MVGFLQNFRENSVLGETDAKHVVQRSKLKAVELAMLGQLDEAVSILAAVQGLPTYNSGAKSMGIAFLFSESGRSNPERDENLDEDALDRLEVEAARSLPHLPENIKFHEVTEDSYSELKRFTEEMEKSEYAEATTGYVAMRLSAALAGLLIMANKLGHESDIAPLMKRIAKRVHYNQQSEYLSTVRCVWKEYLLSGWLRTELDIDATQLQEYASFVLNTLKARLENGPIRPRDIYANYSLQNLVVELDQNTTSDPEFGADEHGFDPDETIHSIIKPPATVVQIKEAEKRIGRNLPQDLLDFLRVTNGCLTVREHADPSYFGNRLPPVEDMFLEDDGYMLDYQFELLPDADLGVEVDWTGIDGGGIAIYEHNGQGTEYVWILTEGLVETAKKRLQDAYDVADDEHKEKIDCEIIEQYGSRESFDEMKSCLYLQHWGQPEGMVFPTFRDYLNWVVFCSRGSTERSPLKMPRN